MAVADGAQLWVDKFIPKHFQKSATRRYGYKPRKGMEFARGTKEFWDSYSGQKLKYKHHLIPLVFSGKTRELAKDSKVKPIAKRAEVRTPARGLNRKHPKSEINMREEFQTILPVEHVEMAARMELRFQREIDTLRTRRTRPIGG
ncbi:MAG TPA: hypothetical protein VNA25_30095 [Phycisphaerae bacterium]|nr:hypothetical protein [Phycisphaerae bacterium]